MDLYERRVLRLREHVKNNAVKSSKKADITTTNTVSIEDKEIGSNDKIEPYKIDDLSKDEIIEILAANGIKHNKRDRKDVLFKLLP